jgi:hypothetical protein
MVEGVDKARERQAEQEYQKWLDETPKGYSCSRRESLPSSGSIGILEVLIGGAVIAAAGYGVYELIQYVGDKF